MAFADGVASKPATEAMRQMNSIKRRLQDLAECLAPGCTRTNLMFMRIISHRCSDLTRGRAHSTAKGLPLQRTWAHISRAFRTVKRTPNNKAPGPDGATAEILKLGRQALVSVTYPLYRAVRAWGLIPSDWNVAALQLIWKAKGRRDDVDKYRPIAIT